MPRVSFAERLARLAVELEPVRAPWWVSQPGGPTPAQGWWWIPRGASTPAMLGHNHIVAEVNLLRLAGAQYVSGAAGGAPTLG